ncbi:hypothetical protein [Elizabethkingia anophelis]|uniref:hypothetical protein n=1 Tax=Elizabethkingia anophelis TaxID=1117645 RepID=UPI00136B8E8C|nr:hypothetical protein [Elizabethkingia anophelis]MYY27401.1 hypothetical protein [Elizabethkingia anophelis]
MLEFLLEKKTVFVCLIVFVLFSSCRGVDNLNEKNTEVPSVAISIKHANISEKLLESTQKREISLGTLGKVVATLRPDKIISDPGLESGAKYKIAVYDSLGAKVMDNNFIFGEPAIIRGLSLGQTYTFIGYSINSKNNVPEITPDKGLLSVAGLKNLSSNLVFFKQKLTIARANNKLVAEYKPIFSEVKVNIDASNMGDITAVESYLYPTYASADFSFATEERTYKTEAERDDDPLVIVENYLKKSINSIIPKEARCVSFPEIDDSPIGKPVITSASGIMITPTTASGSYMIKSISVNNRTINNINLRGLNIKEGTRYNLDLNFIPGVISKKTVLSLGSAPWSLVNGYSGSEILKSSFNFGENKATVNSKGFSIVNAGTDKGQLKGNISTYNPDIIIITYPFNLDNIDDSKALFDYLNKGGKVVLFTQTDQRPEKFLYMVGILNSNRNLPFVQSKTNFVKPILNIDHPITNGPFGDLRGKLIGDDNDDTNYIADGLINRNNINVLSENSDGVIGFVHKKYKLFYWADGGFVTGVLGNTSKVNYPAAIDIFGKPIAKKYNKDYIVYNSIMYANLMAWLIN